MGSEVGKVETCGMVGGLGRLRRGSDTGTGVGRTREGGVCMEREHEALLFLGLEQRRKLGPCEYLCRGYSPAERVPESRK